MEYLALCCWYSPVLAHRLDCFSTPQTTPWPTQTSVRTREDFVLDLSTAFQWCALSWAIGMLLPVRSIPNRALSREQTHHSNLSFVFSLCSGEQSRGHQPALQFGGHQPHFEGRTSYYAAVLLRSSDKVRHNFVNRSEWNAFVGLVTATSCGNSGILPLTKHWKRGEVHKVEDTTTRKK